LNAQRADTEVRAPARLTLVPLGGLCGCERIGFPAHGDWLPIGAGVFG